MSVCSSCGTDNPERFRFCGACGALLGSLTCPSCGAGYDPGQHFCGSCGHTLHPDPSNWATAGIAAPAAPPAQERKLATVLFADVVGFTSLSERTDPEVVARMVDSAFRQLGEVVADHGGTVDKYMGDSLMAVFGVPASHDDDAERAVAAGLAMRRLGGDLVFSIGINSGEVMVTPVGDSGGATVIGDAVNVAARLEKAAGPGEVLCGGLTAELVGPRGMFRARQPVVLKGKSEPFVAWEAVGLRTLGEGQPRDEPPLLGRSGELGYLEALWQRVCREDEAQVVLLCGEAGSGKTRLLSELVRIAAADGTAVRAAYPSYGAMGAARVAADVLAQLGPAVDSEVTKRVRSLAGVSDESLQAFDPASLRQEQTWALARFLEEKASGQPLLIAIDDMHRSAETTRKVLVELQGRTHRIPLLIVLAGRTEPDQWLSEFPGAATIRLAPLGADDAATLAKAFVCDGALADEAAAFLAERARGNPLYLRELIRVASADGALVPDLDADDGLHLARPGAVPATLQSLLAARLDSLGSAQKTVFQYLALFGEGATAAQLGGMGAPDVETALNALVDAGLVRRGNGGGHQPLDPLLSEVAYEALPHHLRGELHRRASDVAPSPEDRARHMDRAAVYLSDEAVTTEAAGVLADLGEEFAAESRHAEALRLLERAVALGCRRPSALFTLSDLQQVYEDQDAASATLALVEPDPADPAVEAHRDHAIAVLRMFSDPEWATGELAKLVIRWDELCDPLKQAWAQANMGVAIFEQNRMEQAAEALDLALAMFEEIGDRAGLVATVAFLCLARPTDPRVPAWLTTALEYAEEEGDRVKQVNALIPLAWHHFLRSIWGDVSQMTDAERFAQRLADLASEFGGSELSLHGLSLLTLSARLTGRLGEASVLAEKLEGGIGPRSGSVGWLGWAACFAVAVASGATQAAPPYPPTAAGDPTAEVAANVIASELVFAGRLDEVTLHARPEQRHGVLQESRALLEALCLVLGGRPEEALQFAEKAVVAARALNAKPLETAARALIAEITGDPDGLAPMPESAGSVADLLVLRAYAALGDAPAAERLREGARRLAMPALAIHLRAPEDSAGQPAPDTFPPDRDSP